MGDREAALKIWSDLTRRTVDKKQFRSDEAFIASPHARKPLATLSPENWPEGWCKGWAFTIQPTLATALDIQLTPRVTDKQSSLEWSQGSRFDFREGYTLHDAPEAWTLPWGEALPHIANSLQITSAIPAEPANTGSPRNTGQVTFQLYRPNAERTALERRGNPYTVSQDDFVRILIVGLPQG